MTIFTSEENKPTEFTLRLIRQMAYTYRVARIDGRAIPFSKILTDILFSLSSKIIISKVY